MKVVCFSYNAPPKNDAEGFCTARFLSALSQHGADVHLITMDHPGEVEPPAIEALLDSRIQVTRIPLSGQSCGNLCQSLKCGVLGTESLDFARCVAEVRNALSSQVTTSAVLVTRAYPAFSNMVGYKCRKDAAMWVAHFGDPYPGFQMYSRRNSWRRFVDQWWGKRIFNEADLVTVTCRNAVRWFAESLGEHIKAKMHVVYHVGFPHLRSTQSIFSSDRGSQANDVLKFTHVGFWSERRSMGRVLEEFAEAAALLPKVELRQFGPTDLVGRELLNRLSTNFLSVCAQGASSPFVSSELLVASDVNVVIDQNDSIGYCPYLASKFAYCVASQRPILAVGEPDSEMAKLHEEYGSFYFADVTRPGALRNVVCEIAKAPSDGLKIPSDALSALFRPETVAKAFLDRTDDMLRSCARASRAR